MRIIETCPQCGHDLIDTILYSYQAIPKKECLNCGWSWTCEQEEVIRIPFGGNGVNITEQPSLNDYLNLNLKDSLVDNFEQSSCDNCPNHTKNGGNGMCNCTLGLPKVTC